MHTSFHATSTHPPILRIALLDDHDVVLQGFAARLGRETDLKVVGMYKTLPEMLAGLQKEPADLLIVDYSLGPKNMDGANMITLLRKRFPKSKVLVASSHDNPSTVALAMRSGAKGFLGKIQDLSELVSAVRTIALGRRYLSPTIVSPEFSDMDMTLRSESAPTTLSEEKKLSPKEKEVLRCFLEGMTVTEIANKFMRSPKTISTQKHHAYRKLGIRSDSELYKLRHLVEGFT